MYKILKLSTYEELIKENHDLTDRLLLFELKEKEYEDFRLKSQNGIGNYLNAEYINLIKYNVEKKKCEEIIINITVQYANKYIQNVNFTNTCMWYGLVITDGENELIKVTIITDEDKGFYSNHSFIKRNKNLLLTKYIGEYLKHCLESDIVISKFLKKISMIEDFRVDRSLFRENLETLEN